MSHLSEVEYRQLKLKLFRQVLNLRAQAELHVRCRRDVPERLVAILEKFAILENYTHGRAQLF